MRLRRLFVVLAASIAALLVGATSASAASGTAARDLPSFLGCPTLNQSLSVYGDSISGTSQAPLVWNNNVCDGINIIQALYVVDTATNSVVYNSGPRQAYGTQVQTNLNFTLSPTQYVQLNSVFSRGGSSTPTYVAYVYANGSVGYATA
ncbi:hypothetical protein [Micromonospora sp. AKA38]|uniref:hypothetical protein n=1 Tax=Micromonospora sp. AKA38 TaxID=2733861 RepID=UPI0022C53CD4|nr:hypothetical protein [Micromonospora sp. AKA38]GHJ15915.1 hypothetical protein TPA0908_39100 [Micromonospora sp. AKA38]